MWTVLHDVFQRRQNVVTVLHQWICRLSAPRTAAARSTQSRRRITLLLGSMSLVALLSTYIASRAVAAPSPRPGGELHILDQQGQPSGACPLKHTEVEANIQGFFSRVHVRQVFHNPLATKIEAVYVFPLPQNAAVDTMTMTVGERRIVGHIKPRDEARQIYAAARAAGHVASLLDQERPNIFTQSVANVEPGAEVVIEISYVDTLQYEDGLFEFIFPMVVGPRYMPGSPIGKQGTGWVRDTTSVPDASHLSPPVAPPGTRAGHDIRLTVHLDAGTEVFDLNSTLHEIRSVSTGKGRATITLANKAEIPNKDFILRYRTATDTIGDSVLLHTDARGTFFTLILQPPRRLRPEHAVPKEMLFVIDRSGSMSGFPIEKAKETMRLAIEQMNPHDTFNLLSFSGGTGRCFPRPMPNTPQNRAMALRYLADLYGSGGTEMMPAILEALGGAHDPQRLRVVAFMTDGYIGNDYAIIDAVRQHAGSSRVFAFGIGNAVNRFLLDGMAHAGRGAVEYVTLHSQADGAAQRFHQRIHAPVLTDIHLDWGTLPVQDVYPKAFPDLFSSQPLVIHGRLAQAVQGTITLSGQTSTGHFSRQIRLAPSASPATHDTLATLWARAAVAELLRQDYTARQRGNMPAARRDQITRLGVEFHLMTPFTSFVAVEELRVTVAGSPMTIAVPVEIPEGVRYEGIFGSGMADSAAPQAQLRSMALPASPAFKSMSRDARLERRAEEESSGRVARVPHAAEKLAPPLVDLEQQVQQDGTDGTLTRDTLRVVHYMVDVMIYLQDTSAETLAALQRLGFIAAAESKTIPLLIGRIDVRHLKQLVQLDAVLRVTPITG